MLYPLLDYCINAELLQFRCVNVICIWCIHIRKLLVLFAHTFLPINNISMRYSSHRRVWDADRFAVTNLTCYLHHSVTSCIYWHYSALKMARAINLNRYRVIQISALQISHNSKQRRAIVTRFIICLFFFFFSFPCGTCIRHITDNSIIVACIFFSYVYVDAQWNCSEIAEIAAGRLCISARFLIVLLSDCVSGDGAVKFTAK